MFLETLVILFISSLLATFFGLVIYARWNYGTLEALNIPFVKPSFFLGSAPDLHEKIQHLEDIARYKKYGSVYGVYEGRSPTIYVCDPELIRLIFVKDFDHFQDRRQIDLGDPLVNDFLDFLPVDKWREIRGSMSPIFTTGKLKMMSTSFKTVNEEFFKQLTQIVDSKGRDGAYSMDMRQLFDGLVMDMICRSAFGIKIGDPLDPDNLFVRLFKDLQGTDADFGLMYTLSMVFPWLTRFAPTLGSDSATRIVAIIRGVMEARKESGNKHNDFIDVLNEMYDKLSSPEYKKLKIAETAVMAQAINFVLAGYDAMCTTMTFLLYNISKHPEIQEKLIQEIDNFMENHDGEIIFEKLSECPYLLACLTETLRLYPPFIRPERMCTKDWKNNGLKITKGTLVMTPAWSVNRNPQVYSDPDNFQPDRFMPENKLKLNSYAFLTFGLGPRNCVGMRYAYEAMKFCMVHFLKHFRVELSPETEIKYKPGILFLIMYDPVNLTLVKRR